MAAVVALLIVLLEAGVCGAGSIVGTVSEAGTSLPISNALVQVISIPSFLANSGVAYSDSQGRFELDIVGGNYEVRVLTPGHLAVVVQVAIPLTGMTTNSFELVPGAFLGGTILRPGGRPGPGRARLFGEDGTWIAEADVADASGRYRFWPLPAGDYRVATCHRWRVWPGPACHALNPVSPRLRALAWSPCRRAKSGTISIFR